MINIENFKGDFIFLRIMPIIKSNAVAFVESKLDIISAASSSGVASGISLSYLLVPITGR